jgi:hypothetical protein
MTATLSMADFDHSTRSASGFILKYIAPRLEPFQLYGPLARRLPFSLTARNSDVIIVVGHGDSDMVTGQNDTVLLKVGEYSDDEVKDKVIYSFTCQSGDYLGPDLIDHGAAAFLGWTDDYLWILDEMRTPVPWEDKLAKPCMMPVVAGLNALLDGKTVSEVRDIQKQSYNDYAAGVDDELIRDLVLFNRDNFVLYGDPEARIVPRPQLAWLFQVIPPPPMLLPI